MSRITSERTRYSSAVQNLPFDVADDPDDLLDLIPANDPCTQLKNALIQKVASSITINAYGQRSLTLDIRLRRRFQWVFVQADVKSPVIEADFLTHFGLTVDLRQCKLVDTTTTLFIVGTAASEPSASIQLTVPSSPFADILKGYSSLTKPCQFTGRFRIWSNTKSSPRGNLFTLILAFSPRKTPDSEE
nr:unnamed protein product [Spirometra erinaceieuropaei]